ncbi:homeodomain transcription factor [Mycena maculata]|uniref:Homeodomain transcription factor n=1 Tax=Mycena maculata TaxID=230809 RepID=A0AAD7MQ65_9AGAR|nr:homeodomain transcription factor [Mycena maculata]
MRGTPQTRTKLQIDPSVPEDYACTPSPSPDSTALSSTRPSSASSQTTEDEDEKDCVCGVKSDREKPKRSRVTPEQLVHLERFFSAERSPTAARRREISELLGMQERQTQIWFQNRRAKAKLQNTKLKKAKEMCQGPEPHMLPSLSTNLGNELNNLIHEDEAVTFIPCSDLSIGSWRRIATDTSQHDLVAYTCETKRCLTWFIYNGGIGFKMEIPFDTIIDTEFTNTSPGPTGLASFVLSRPPIFYLENTSHDGSPRYWKRCTDWTEGHQASHVLRHDLIGSTVPLVHLLQSLQSNSEVSSPYSPHSHYRSEPPSPMEIPPPPLSVIQRTEQQYPEEYNPIRPNNSFRRRSFAAANDLSHIVVSGLSHYRRDLPHTAPAVSYTHTSYLPAHAYSPAYSPPSVAEPAEEHSLEDYGALPVSHDMTPRPYSAQPVPRRFYEKPSPFFYNPFSTDECGFTDADSGVAQMYYRADSEIAFAG